jgi:hypothetical protein
LVTDKVDLRRRGAKSLCRAKNCFGIIEKGTVPMERARKK